METKQHWNKAYNTTQLEKTGWYQKHPLPSLQLIKACKLPKNATILNVGSGTSTLINQLLKEQYTNIIVNDISKVALQKLKKNIAKKDLHKVQFIEDDLTNSTKLPALQKVDLWHDRAVLHFFLDEKQKDAYFNLVKEKVKKNGFVIIAVFSKNGAKKCCGLDLCLYSSKELQDRLGTKFSLLKTFNYTFINPFGGKRPYIYTLFQYTY